MINEQQIIDDLNACKKKKDIIREQNISKHTLKEIMNKRYSGEELEALRWQCSRQRAEQRAKKWFNLYHSDEKYRLEKIKKAKQRYWINIGKKIVI